MDDLIEFIKSFSPFYFLEKETAKQFEYDFQSRFN